MERGVKQRIGLKLVSTHNCGWNQKRLGSLPPSLTHSVLLHSVLPRSVLLRSVLPRSHPYVVSSRRASWMRADEPFRDEWRAAEDNCAQRSGEFACMPVAWENSFHLSLSESQKMGYDDLLPILREIFRIRDVPAQPIAFQRAVMGTSLIGKPSLSHRLQMASLSSGEASW